MSRPTDWLVRDLRQSVRARVRNISSTAIIAITIAAGLACNAIAFSLTRTLLLRPYPFHQLERLCSCAMAGWGTRVVDSTRSGRPQRRSP